MTPPILLALDSATDTASIALYDGERVLSETTWHSVRRHTVELMPHIVASLAQANLTPQNLAGVAVAIGPGSFTGIRVALAVAKGIAEAGNLPLFGISTLETLAYPHRAQPLPVTALVQAGRGRVCWARFDQNEERTAWKTVSNYAISTVEAVAEVTNTATLFTGEIFPGTRTVLTTNLGVKANFAPAALAFRRAGVLAELAWPRFLAGDADNIATLAPIYLHELTPGAAL